jgi:hypothetical protein
VSREGRQPFDQGACHLVAALAVWRVDEHDGRLERSQGPDGRAVGLVHDAVALPMSGLGAVGNCGRALGDDRHGGAEAALAPEAHRRAAPETPRKHKSHCAKVGVDHRNVTEQAMTGILSDREVAAQSTDPGACTLSGYRLLP